MADEQAEIARLREAVESLRTDRNDWRRRAKKIALERGEAVESFNACRGYGEKWKLKCAEARKERDEARQANAALLEGLRFYGEPRNQFPRRVVIPVNACPVEKDGGQRARNLLTQYDTAQGEEPTK